MSTLSSETRLISVGTVLSTLILGPIVAFVYAWYSLGYWLKRKGSVLFYPLFALFAVVNTLHNWTVCTLIFREFPKEFFTTSRLKRLKHSTDPSKRELADLLGGFLNSQDPGHY